MDNRSIANDRVFVQHGSRADEHVAPDLAAGQHVRPWQYRRALANEAIIANGGPGVNVHAWT